MLYVEGLRFLFVLLYGLENYFRISKKSFIKKKIYITSTNFIENNCPCERKLFKIISINYKFFLIYSTRSTIILHAISNETGPLSKNPRDP